MELTSGRVLGPMTKWPRVSLSDIQMNVEDISLGGRVSLAVLKSLKLSKVVHAALIRADWIPLPCSCICERSCMGYSCPMADLISEH